MVYIKKGYDRSPEKMKRMVETRRKNGSYIAWNKGLKLGTYNEQFGKTKAEEMSRKHTESAKKFYREHPEARKKISIQLKNRKLTEERLNSLREQVKEMTKLRTPESFRKQAEKIRGRKCPQISETRKRLFKEGKIKMWNDRMKIDRTKYPKFGRFGKRSEEERLKMKERRRYQKKSFSSSIELKIQEFLKQLEIGFFTHFYINIKHDYQTDIFIPVQRNKDRLIKEPIVIECDGDYWHTIENRIERDKLRTQELEDKGIRVIRIWEHDIKPMEIKQFKEIIKDKIGVYN